MAEVCSDCGVLVEDQAVHKRFHSILSSHGWALAVLQTSHISREVHDKFDVRERIQRRRFDNWSADALAEVMASLPTDPGRELNACPRCDDCGQVANTENQEPWTAWTSLPPGSDAAVRMGLVKPIPCPVCGGAAPFAGE